MACCTEVSRASVVALCSSVCTSIRHNAKSRSAWTRSISASASRLRRALTSSRESSGNLHSLHSALPAPSAIKDNSLPLSRARSTDTAKPSGPVTAQSSRAFFGVGVATVLLAQREKISIPGLSWGALRNMNNLSSVIPEGDSVRVTRCQHHATLLTIDQIYRPT